MQPIASVLPASFEFYHLGPVRTQTEAETPPRTELLAELSGDVSTFAYEVHTFVEDRRLFLLISFDGRANRSVYSELGNVIGSRLADGLAAGDEHSVTISPPRELGPKAAERLVRTLEPVYMREYVHQVSDDSPVMVTATVLESTGEAAHV